MTRKLLICPWFGPLPTWMPLWESNVASLEQYGYDVLRVHDLKWFKEQVRETLGVECPIVSGEGKIHDYRCAFGVIFAHLLTDYHYWGHTDFDCVYGRVGHFLPDDELSWIDQFSNHATYVSGPWSLYRNESVVNELFKRVDDWRGYLENPSTTGWVEHAYSQAVEEAHEKGRLRKLWTSWQTQNLDDFSTVHFEDDKLMEGSREIMVAHFRRTKIYPEGCRR
jgi:Family of unknown function (DUF6625)